MHPLRHKRRAVHADGSPSPSSEPSRAVSADVVMTSSSSSHLTGEEDVSPDHVASSGSPTSSPASPAPSSDEMQVDAAEQSSPSFDPHMNASPAPIPSSAMDEYPGEDDRSSTSPHPPVLPSSSLVGNQLSDDDEEELWSKV